MSRPGIPKSWPVLRVIGPLLVSRNDVLGELAGWAVRQSPYTVPDKLAEAVTAFCDAWPRAEYAQFDSVADLDYTIKTTFQHVPEIMAWNERKNGRDGHGYVTRYDKPSPDDDFIDLDALARNMAMAIWHDAADEKQFNDGFDARRAQLPEPWEGGANVKASSSSTKA